MYIVTAEQMRRIDRETIEDIGIPALVLMENAGRAVAEEIVRRRGRTEHPLRVLVLVGKGNNGADGIVAARHLQQEGHRPYLLFADDPSQYRGEAEVQYRIAVKLGLEGRRFADGDTLDAAGFDLVIDALLGTGSTGAPRGSYARLISQANDSGLPIAAVDLPSGLDADTGQVHDPCVRAELTVALAYSKIGLEQYPGAGYAGEVVVRGIGIPPEGAERAGVRTFRVQEPLLSERLGYAQYRRRQPDSHKGTYGHVLVAAGSRPMSGAGLLSATAALRAGSGLVTWALPDRLVDAMTGRLPEAMLRGLADGGTGEWSGVDPHALVKLAAGKDALVFGPGAGRWEGDGHFLRTVWEETGCPLVLDADALNMMGEADGPASWPKRSGSVVVTPHPGEMARLLGVSTAEVQRDRVRAAADYAVRCGVVVVLKGTRTVTAAPSGEVYLNPTGNPGMATGGTGDVLAGIIGSLLGQGYTAVQAAALGAYLHGAAGDRAAAARAHEASLTAGDIPEHL
ncbi:bifunctional ADP-dependent NAD(P)H-hydrate dehydratase/NAD(P)H-hydrate epimerase [Paenibacillus mucilaginosus]|uniref:Bifunctional NAD(P)H-hydrate repair enzyme n=1 Tax=Paenibacillus mucilaginosus (strain KNP414) TaxID=1036673 RepID=F8FC97_PAEMK|nr:bifunctional ADP-dependent NAD(P)H-hydrate dehydratase/NAD(P)H-hydrate epimerase [Paenibacillus mucilaginosus]AEI44498.1 carbohydrate kinase, YjeF related protein [Paenibacillus mucilaginosus KNP414]MCG7217503.1 bifunctional ADP-dependent NAD(P)H-hydrate dehydratase/NAD(P)H-hydrate epimerase [Paenibacillus mucilaginosus]WDM30901.1 bifunctional ADP-dependent NAD(P)H-hydrate dehydratase/NAD(P)H-hydrate epimerase [Paenibacillus mucilaginosus]